MGSSVAKQKRPTGGPPQRKSALKNTKERGRLNDRPDNMDNEPFGTDIFRPDREQQPATLASENERIYPSPRTEQPGERSVQRVHYEDDNDLVDNRDGMDRFMDPNPDGSPRQFRSQLPHNQLYQPPMPMGRPYRQQGPYPYRTLPPQIYPVRLPARRTLPHYGPMYRSPVPVNERYRPAPVYYNSPRAIRRGVPPDQPPPYHALEPMSYRSSPRAEPAREPIPPADSSFPNQNGDQDGGLTDRSAVQYQGARDGSYSDPERYEVPSLLTSDYLTNTKPAKNLQPKSEESVHEKDDDEYIGANLRFYRNQLKFRPNGEFIDYIHKYWYGNYSLLEKLHTYIHTVVVSPV
ncbi:uncharacterized protein LOC123536638 [Mercenaria mercenaria]|uniref:uncharacterized protein LOC123536638 n=1 Tax=Mercenaria mercenaria TaxID=6596 RepID=UPI00234F886E|nr:uncharacterized protein LOC123536638 [Mercenaria mercenaria]